MTRFLLVLALSMAVAGVANWRGDGKQRSGTIAMADVTLTIVTVMLREPASLRSLTDDNDYAKANLALQRSVISKAFGTTPDSLRAAGRGLRQFDFIPGFSVRATASEIARLKADKRVKSVTRDMFMRPSQRPGQDFPSAG